MMVFVLYKILILFRVVLMSVRYPVVPNRITVHLGAPNESVRDITVSFTDYISNVASSELYPTWPKNALIANIYAII